MTKSTLSHFRILALCPSPRGLGFAVLETGEKLVDWGVRSGKRDKRERTVAHFQELVSVYRPGIIVGESFSERSRRSPRSLELSQEIKLLAERAGIKVASFSRARVKKALSIDTEATKHEVAVMLAKRFPQELGSRLPPKRKPWTSEDARMDIFESVGLALAYLTKASRKAIDSEPSPIIDSS
jgi:Holliday junction resolvasome RuvABC endonuclease subunit